MPLWIHGDGVQFANRDSLAPLLKVMQLGAKLSALQRRPGVGGWCGRRTAMASASLLLHSPAGSLPPSVDASARLPRTRGQGCNMFANNARQPRRWQTAAALVHRGSAVGERHDDEKLALAP